MTANQIAYWKNVETHRSNLAQEDIGRDNAYSNRITATSRERDSFTNVKNAETNLFNAQTNRINAGVNLQNADTNRLNAATNRYSAESGRMQANTAQFAAQAQKDIGTQNAATNEKQADTARMKAVGDLAIGGVNAALGVSKETRAWLSPGSYIFGK